VTRTAGTLLGGRVCYEQLADGYRTGIEPVLLAASVPANAGDSVLEAGTGAGAGLLCLAARVPGVVGVGVECDAALAALAATNFAANDLGQLTVHAGDLLSWQPGTKFDHAFANPPWHSAAGSASPNDGRRAAKQATTGLLAAWIAAIARALRPQGTLSLILPSSTLGEAVTSLQAAQFQEIILFPLWPRAGTPTKLMILQGKHLSRSPSSVLPGLVLHENGEFSAEADGILRHARPTKLARATQHQTAPREVP
jgi:tRNA1Val (adenine37-N6)-methyltransferase